MTRTDHGRERVVVGVDGSDQSKHALQWAAHLAELDGLDIDVVMVRPPARPRRGRWTAAAHRNPAAGGPPPLQEVVGQVFGGHCPRGLGLFVVAGDPASVLLERSRQAALLVVGCRGIGGISGLLLGSVSARCVEGAAAPVLVAHHRGPTTDLTTADARPYARVVVGVDGSSSSRRALRWAASYAERAGAHLEAVLVADSSAHLGAGHDHPGPDDSSEAHEARLRRIVEDELGSRGSANTRMIIDEGRASDVLIRRSQHATLLVLGRGGHHGLATLALGSNGAKCAASADCAVAIVRDAGSARASTGTDHGPGR